MIKKLFEATPKRGKQLVAVWDRQDLRLGALAGQRVQVYKQLYWLWDHAAIQASFPATEPGTGWDQSNTVLIDDTEEKARSEPCNLVKITEFTREQVGIEDDTLLTVAAYLNSLRFHTDVSAGMRVMPYAYQPLHGVDHPVTWKTLGVTGEWRD
jgi:hypothetical protein